MEKCAWGCTDHLTYRVLGRALGKITANFHDGLVSVGDREDARLIVVQWSIHVFSSACYALLMVKLMDEFVVVLSRMV